VVAAFIGISIALSLRKENEMAKQPAGKAE
jgi:hypothetical protein